MSSKENNHPIIKKTEKCILCGKDTGIPFSAPIDSRECYIVGCGQLCKDCFDSLQYVSISKNKPFEEETYILLKRARKNSKERVYEEST